MCCHELNGAHRQGEPITCCHVHAEDLPTNFVKVTEPEGIGWTAQSPENKEEYVQCTQCRHVMPISETLDHVHVGA